MKFSTFNYVSKHAINYRNTRVNETRKEFNIGKDYLTISISPHTPYSDSAIECTTMVNGEEDVLYSNSIECYNQLFKQITRSAHQQRRTSLYDLHVEHQGKIVNFGGFELPIQYGAEGIVQSHIHTRSNCSIFDVSHMLQTEIRGKDRIEFLESVCTTDIHGLPENGSALSLFIDDNTGGILDDLIVTKTTEGYLYVVSNASRRDNDSKLLLNAQEAFKKNGKDVTIDFLDPETRSLLAVQGPKMVEILQPLTDIDLSKLYFMQSTIGTIDNIQDCRVTRCGYTGEDGVEISVASNKSIQLAKSLLNSGSDKIKLAGLGARDTLRLEAGLCLYGNDIDNTVTPAQAGLGFTIGKRRREMKDFPGAPIILLELLSGPYKRRVGFKSISHGPPARHGAQIFADDINIGVITSGCPSPNLGCNIAMGYIKKEYSNPGTLVKVQVRDKFIDLEVCKLPLVPTKYFIKKKNK